MSWIGWWCWGCVILWPRRPLDGKCPRCGQWVTKENDDNDGKERS